VSEAPTQSGRDQWLSLVLRHEFFCRRFVRAGGSTTLCVRLEDDGPMVEEFELSLWLAAGRDF
jgi:hypothetical protein